MKEIALCVGHVFGITAFFESGVLQGGFGDLDHWSLLSLVLCVLQLASAGLMVFMRLRGRTRGGPPGSTTQDAVVVLGITAVPLFFLLEDFEGTVALLNSFTSLFLAFTLLHIVGWLLYAVRLKGRK